MPVEPGLLSFAGLACLAIARGRHGPLPGWAGRAPLPMARVAGWLLIALSFAVGCVRLGGALGTVAWIGQTCLAGIALVLLTSFRSRFTVQLASLALLTGAASAVLLVRG
jgi:hypothetical protein